MKINQKKTYIMALLLVSLIFIISACTAPKKVNIEPIYDESSVREVIPLVKSSSTLASEKQMAEQKIKDDEENAKSIICGDDENCFIQKLINCYPADFKKIFTEGERQLNIIGPAGERCYLQGGLYKNEVLVGSSFSCRIPKNLLSADTYSHFFGLDKVAGKEEIKNRQDKIEAAYCRQD